MYEVKKTAYGIYFKFDEEATFEERARSFRDALFILPQIGPVFSVYTDLRGHRLIPKEALVLITQGALIYRKKGMIRSVVIVDSALVVKQLRRYAQRSGACAWERYIYTSETDNWEQAAQDWLVSGVEPFEDCGCMRKQA